ncbi:MAG: HDOD domain-containing protein [Nitrospirae bacterium]|nr:HDOD domain-containing protein [Nitrospirota bacterium]
MIRIPVDYIESGSFSVGGKENRVLKALLGACVGVAMHDPGSGVGGLFHIILPAPVGTDMPWNAAAYATTGLPLFIDALCKQGADKGRLTAVIGGGALIGDMAEYDLDLDIGGRTAEVVFDILKQYSIPIDRSETGGVFNMALSLDLNTGQSAISPVLEKPLEPAGEVIKPTSDEIANAIARIRPIPQVALKIIRMISDNSYSMQDVSEEVRRDQIIAAKVLTLANSAMIGWPDHIDSVDEALLVLGEKKLLRLVVSASVEIFFSKSERGYSQCKGTLYHHAIGTALVAEQLARLTGKYDASAAYTAGLLHDIGKVVLDHFVAQNMPLFYRQTCNDAVSLEDAEVGILGIGHQEAGGRLAGLWSIPENLTEAIRYHHQPDKALRDTELVCIVSLADLIISRFLVSQTLECKNTAVLSFVLDKLDMKADHLFDLLGTISWDTLNSMRL